jgi:hypothetical protein
MCLGMKPYGMDRQQAADTDARACAQNGRATRAYSTKPHAYRSLRGGKKAAARRSLKRAARREGTLACQLE